MKLLEHGEDFPYVFPSCPLRDNENLVPSPTVKLVDSLRICILYVRKYILP